MRLIEKIRQLFSCRKESNTCVLLSGSEGYSEKATCWIKSGQPLSEKGDFEFGCRLGLSPWLGCDCPSNPRQCSSEWSTLDPGKSETSE